MLRRLLFIIVLFTPIWASPIISTDRNLSLKTLESRSLLFEYHKMTTVDSKRSYYFPRRDSSWKKQEEQSLLHYGESRGAFWASIIGGIDYRGSSALNDTIFPGVDGGLYLRGYLDSLEFMIDARIYNERHYSDKIKSFDREFLEHQKAENNSGFEYTSYARYRGHFALNIGFARLDLARDALHWGPAYYNNLTLNQFSVPYNSMSLELQLGPLSVLSFYGDLMIYASSMSDKNKDNRHVYGHRYELALGSFVLGVSELQVLYELNHPWLFVPIVPLFMEKGNHPENSNNGSISIDIAYHFMNFARVYTEFFLDDMESPVSLIKNDNIEAKWAWLAGFQMGKNFTYKSYGVELGLIAEYSRVEPFVYSHFKANTAQIAHLGHPLGNQAGPNSQNIDFNVYSRIQKRLQIGLHSNWHWKGTDYGSALNDTTPKSNHMNIPKKFLDGASMKYTLSPSISYSGDFFFYMLELSFIGERAVFTRFGFKW